MYAIGGTTSEFFFSSTEAYMIILARCDMVLRIQWLVTLGPIIWNFKVLTMEFTVASQSFLLQGLIAPFLWEESDLVGSKGESSKGLFLHLLNNVEESVREPLGLLLNLRGYHLTILMTILSL
jgi:hypothetical protein